MTFKTAKQSNGEYIGDTNLFGKAKGEGTLYFSNGDNVSSSFWVNGEINGSATYCFDNGDDYHGQFVNGVPHGPGRFFGRDGSEIVMEFVNGRKVSERRVK